MIEMIRRLVAWAGRRARPSWGARSGRWGEKEAERHLRGKGYRILGRRVSLDPRSEIDLVAVARKVLVFVEVKTRGSEDYGRPAAAVTRRKRQAISRAAVRYLQRLRYPAVCLRFDVVEVVGNPADGVEALRHIENAFPLDRRYQLPI